MDGMLPRPPVYRFVAPLNTWHPQAFDKPGDAVSFLHQMDNNGLLFLAITALRAYAFFVQRDAAERAAVNAAANGEFCRSGIDSAGEGDFGNVQLVLQQVVDNLDHAFHGHGFLRHHQTAVRVGGGEFGLEGFALHGVARMSVADALLVVHVKDGGQQRVVLTEDERVVKVLQYVPCHFLDFVAGIHHVDARLNGVFHLKGEHAGVAVQVLGFALETIETVGVLEVECGDTSHVFSV